MKRSTTLVIAVAAVLIIGVGLLGLVSGIGFLLYEQIRAKPFNSATPEALEATPFVDAAGDFRIRPPRSWTLDPDPTSNARFLWKSPDVDTVGTREFRPNISVTNGLAYSADATDAVIHRLRSDHSDFNLLSNRHVSINGLNSHIIDYTYTAKTNWPIHIQQTIIDSGNSIYIITASCHVSTWETHRPALEASLATFEALH